MPSAKALTLLPYDDGFRHFGLAEDARQPHAAGAQQPIQCRFRRFACSRISTRVERRRQWADRKNDARFAEGFIISTAATGLLRDYFLAERPDTKLYTFSLEFLEIVSPCWRAHEIHGIADDARARAFDRPRGKPPATSSRPPPDTPPPCIYDDFFWLTWRPPPPRLRRRFREEHGIAAAFRAATFSRAVAKGA